MTMPITKILFSSLILLYSLFAIGSNAQTNITLGSTLTAGSNSPSWLSPSGDFAFGFHRLANGLFLLGIWFDKIEDKTLVWSANRDTPTPAGSTISLTAAGDLELTHPNGTIIKQIYNAAVAAKSASMQDDGNFVLKNSASEVVWQSFDDPTDTILPGQTLVVGKKLYSNANGTVDFSIGRFMLEIQEDRNVVLSAFRYVEKGYWFTNTGSQPNVSLVFNETTALMYLVNLTAPIYSMTLAGNLKSPIENYYHRATIEDTGNFQQFIYPKANGSKWMSVWSAVTEPCFVNGICGVYGYCTSPDNQTASCSCLPGYSPLDPNVPSKGCYPIVPPQQCSKTSSVEYEIQEINDADLANDLFADMAWIPSGDLENCKKALREDCLCMAAVVNSSTCVKKKIPFMNARKSNSTKGYRALIKVPIIKTNQTREVRKNHRSQVIAKIGFFTSISLAVFFAAIAIYHHPAVGQRGLRKPLVNPNAADINLRAFTFQELYEATDGFSNKLEERGAVFSGTLILEDGQVEIAVKKLEKEIEQNEKNFLTEVRVIGRTHHKNLVKLLGYCNEESHRILVYELIKNGPLSGFLFGEGEKPNWDCRANIVLGIAKGLSYLHEECENQIIHCDIKPQNVLLDQRNTAKITDFGLAKQLMNGQARTGTNVRGTPGYMAPEWIKEAPITAKVDVFSFGVMLLEIICCRRHTELKQRVEETEAEEEQDESILIDWVLNCVKLGKLEMVVKHDPEVLNDFARFERMAMVGLWCVHPDPLLRYPMKKVVQMLEGTIEVGIPPLINPQSLEIHLQ